MKSEEEIKIKLDENDKLYADLIKNSKNADERLECELDYTIYKYMSSKSQDSTIKEAASIATSELLSMVIKTMTSGGFDYNQFIGLVSLDSVKQQFEESLQYWDKIYKNYQNQDREND